MVEPTQFHARRFGSDGESRRDPESIGSLLEAVLKRLAPVVPRGVSHLEAVASERVSPGSRLSESGSSGGVTAGNSVAATGIAAVQARWEFVAGPEVSACTKVLRYRQGVLFVEVDSVPLRSELESFARRDLLRQMEEQGLTGIHDLRFVTVGSSGLPRGRQ